MARISTKPAPSAQAALDRLTLLAQKTPDLGEAADFLRMFIPLLHRARFSVNPVRMDAKHAGGKLAAGVPVLVDENLPFDFATARSLFLALCKMVESHDGRFLKQPHALVRLFGPRKGAAGALGPLEAPARNIDESARRALAAQEIRHAVEAGDLNMSGVLALQVSGERQPMVLSATHATLDAGLVQLLAQNTLKPFLRVWAESIQADTNAWNRGHCPMCGASPTLSELIGKTGARRLRCGMCGCGWGYPRLRCASCGNSDHKSLTQLAVEGEDERYFVQGCDACSGFIKMVVSFEPIAVELIAVEDLATMHLDFIAGQRGYKRAQQ